MPRREPKLQRWTDLLAALLRHHYPATFEQLAKDVPAYSGDSKKKDAVMRMFERDKDELRALGIPIETVSLGDGDLVAYRLPPKKFYLPYLQVASMRGRAVPQKRVGHFGYHSLQSLAFEPDELEVIADSSSASKVRTGKEE